MEGGVSGNLTTLDPALSPMLWTSVATGKMAYPRRRPEPTGHPSSRRS